MGKNRAELVERRRDDGKERKKLAEDTDIGGEQGVNREREEEEEEEERERSSDREGGRERERERERER